MLGSGVHNYPIGQITQTRRSDGSPDPDGVQKETLRIKTRHYRNIYLNRQDPIAFLQWTLQTVCMMTSFVFFSCMFTVRHLL